MTEYLKAGISNGQPREQALIRRWWHETQDARGMMVWEFYLEGLYLDAVWFPEAALERVEESGRGAPERFPIQGARVVLCEAKCDLSPELIGQAVVYRQLASRAGGIVNQSVILAERGTQSLQEVARELGLTVVVLPLDET